MYECTLCLYLAVEFPFPQTIQLTRDVLPSFTTGALRVPIDSTFAMEDASKAHDRMRENKNIGKILITLTP